MQNAQKFRDKLNAGQVCYGSFITCTDPTVTDAPTVAMDSPTDGSVLGAPTSVIGTAADAHLVYYTLSVAPLDSMTFTEVYRGTTSVASGALGTFDPTLLADGTYILRLTAVNTGGKSASVDHQLDVRGNLKLGNFKIGFTDLSVPVSGIPITLTRTYDTLNAGTSESRCTVVMPSVWTCVDAPRWFGRLMRGSNTLKLVDPVSTVTISDTLTTVPRSETSTRRIWRSTRC